MSLSGTLSNALSGLTVSSRMVETVSSNVANAMTEGYARREVELGQRFLAGQGAGVQVLGISRKVDAFLIADRRQADAQVGMVSTSVDFLTRVEQVIGLPDDPGSLSMQLSTFSSSLTEAASRPDSDARLQASVSAAIDVANKLNSISDTIQSERQRAEADIASAVSLMNSSLKEIADLNGQIMRFSGQGNDASSLLDMRQRLIDGLSELVPIREIPRDNGAVTLMTVGGAVLLEGRPAEIGFSQAGVITADLSIANNTLSGLTINGRDIATDPQNGPISGGRLAALFEQRDVTAPSTQARLDAMARDFVERFQDASVDPSLAPGDAGLFTDAGSAFDIADEQGLASRIAVNTLVDPVAGGDPWRMRDGLGAMAPGSIGDARLLLSLGDALSSLRTPQSGGFTAPDSSGGIAADLLSGVSTSLRTLESRQTFALGLQESLKSQELQSGVDTDAEMQKLLRIEQAYAANARVIATVDELIQSLLRI